MKYLIQTDFEASICIWIRGGIGLNHDFPEETNFPSGLAMEVEEWMDSGDVIRKSTELGEEDLHEKWVAYDCVGRQLSVKMTGYLKGCEELYFFSEALGSYERVI